VADKENPHPELVEGRTAPIPAQSHNGAYLSDIFDSQGAPPNIAAFCRRMR